MNQEEWIELMHREEAKRNRMWNPAERWKIIQELIDWADLQKAVPRNSKEGCLAAQRRLLERMHNPGD